MVRSPNPIFPFFQLCGLSIPTNPTTKPSPSRELDGAEIFHNPKKNPIISPVLALYPVLNPSEKGKNQTPCPHCGDAAGDNNHLGNALECARGESIPLFLLWQGLHWNGWAISQILIIWQEENPTGRSTLFLEHSQGNVSLRGLFNGITMKKNQCLLNMKICSSPFLSFGLQKTPLPRAPLAGIEDHWSTHTFQQTSWSLLMVALGKLPSQDVFFPMIPFSVQIILIDLMWIMVDSYLFQATLGKWSCFLLNSTSESYWMWSILRAGTRYAVF